MTRTTIIITSVLPVNGCHALHLPHQGQHQHHLTESVSVSVYPAMSATAVFPPSVSGPYTFFNCHQPYSPIAQLHIPATSLPPLQRDCTVMRPSSPLTPLPLLQQGQWVNEAEAKSHGSLKIHK